MHLSPRTALGEKAPPDLIELQQQALLNVASRPERGAGAEMVIFPERGWEEKRMSDSGRAWTDGMEGEVRQSTSKQTSMCFTGICCFV